MSSEPPWERPGGAVDVDQAIVVEVERGVPDEAGHVASGTARYELHPGSALNILGIFREIYFQLDPTFGFRNFECGRGICSTCNVMYEGRVQKGCRILVPLGSRVRIGPQDPGNVLRDVVCTAVADTDAEDD